jgi:hypothetical protein
MKKLLLFLLLVALPLSFATTFDELDSIASSAIDQPLQQPFSTLFGSERFNITITSENTTYAYNLVTEDGIITQAGAGEVENATLTASVSITTIETILSAEDQFGALVEAYENEEIGIEGNTAGNKLKVGIAKFFATIIGWFV